MAMNTTLKTKTVAPYEMKPTYSDSRLSLSKIARFPEMSVSKLGR